MANEKFNFAVQTTREQRDRAMELLAQMDGDNNGEKLASMMHIVKGALERKGLSADYKGYVDSIKQSQDNINTNVDAIIKAAEEERKHNEVELHEQIDAHVKTIKAMQHDCEEYQNRIKTAEDAKAQAEKAAEQANAEVKRLDEIKTQYERAAHNRDSLVTLLEEKVADLQVKLSAAEDKIVELNTMLAKPTAEQTTSPAEYEHIDEDNAPPF